MIFDFKDKHIVITGGTRGIGEATAKLFAAAGGNVHLLYQNHTERAEKLLKSLNSGNHSIHRVDISQPTEIEAFFNEYASTFGVLDVLVNNAGVFIEHKIEETSFNQWREIWDQTIQVNLVGAANMCFFASRLMIKANRGKIINISSRGAFRGEPDCPAYGASKAGLNAMSQSLAVALAPHQISVHIIAPGFVATEMAEEILNGETGNAVKQQSPFNRVAQPAEVAKLVAVYASDGLEFTSAGIIDINGASYLRS